MAEATLHVLLWWTETQTMAVFMSCGYTRGYRPGQGAASLEAVHALVFLRRKHSGSTQNVILYVPWTESPSQETVWLKDEGFPVRSMHHHQVQP
jgi:hypothetical protein